MALKEIIETVPTFKTEEEKEKFLIALGALSLRFISLAKASEIMGMEIYLFKVSGCFWGRFFIS